MVHKDPGTHRKYPLYLWRIHRAKKMLLMKIVLMEDTLGKRNSNTNTFWVSFEFRVQTNNNSIVFKVCFKVA